MVGKRTAGVVLRAGAALSKASSSACELSTVSRPACRAATRVWMVYPGMMTDASICHNTVSTVRSAASSFASLQISHT